MLKIPSVLSTRSAFTEADDTEVPVPSGQGELRETACSGKASWTGPWGGAEGSQESLCRSKKPGAARLCEQWPPVPV